MINIKNGQPVHAIQSISVQQSAEEAYLSSLLSPVSEHDAHEDDVELQTMYSESDVKSEPVSVPVPEQQLDTPKQAKVEKTEPESVEMLNRSDAPESVNGDYQLNRPQLPFACQLISVAGLRLALPLSSFSQILPWPENIVPAINAKSRLIGHMHHRTSVLDIVDLSGIIMNRESGELTQNGNNQYSSVILLQGGNTCLPCDEVIDVVTVNPDKVCWRNTGSQRIWLAGTIKNEGYALLDVEGIMRLLGDYL